MKTTYNKSEILKEAWNMYKVLNDGLSFSECLQSAWNNAKSVINLNKKTVKEIYNIIYLGFNKSSKFQNGEYSSAANRVLETVKDNSNGFQSDIANKAYDGIELTSKQAWCVAYEFKNVA